MEQTVPPHGIFSEVPFGSLFIGICRSATKETLFIDIPCSAAFVMRLND
jgi:hypothetical protein